MTMAGQTSGGDIRPGLVTAGREIEQESFRIIDAEMGSHTFRADQWAVVRRIIHTTGDFEFARQVRFHPRAIAAGVEALQKGAAIITDTRMIQVGLSTWRLEWFGNEVLTPMTDPGQETGDNPFGGGLPASPATAPGGGSRHRQRTDGAPGSAAFDS